MSAGMVKTTPPAIDSPADPIVWTMLFSRIVDPPSRLRTEIASTAIGIDALTVSPARRPRYTVDAPKSRPKSAPSTIARNVNSAGDCEAGTYGVNWVSAMRGFYFRTSAAPFAARSNPIQSDESCENVEQTAAAAGTGLRAHDQPALDLPALPGRARRGRRSDDLLAGPRRAVPLERRPDSQGSGVFRRIRRARRRVLRQGSAASSAADPRARQKAARRDHGRGQPRARAGRLSWLPAGGIRDRRALRRVERKGRPRLARRRCHLRHPAAEEGRQERSHQHRRDCRAGHRRATGPEPGRDGGREGGSQLFARPADGAGGREAEERGPDAIAREPVVLSRAR